MFVAHCAAFDACRLGCLADVWYDSCGVCVVCCSLLQNGCCSLLLVVGCCVLLLVVVRCRWLLCGGCCVLLVGVACLSFVGVRKFIAPCCCMLVVAC